MRKEPLDRLAMEWILDQSERIERKIFKSVAEKNEREVNEIDSNLRRLMHDWVALNALKLVEFPKFVMVHTDTDHEAFEEYDLLWESLKHTLYSTDYRGARSFRKPIRRQGGNRQGVEGSDLK